MKSAFAHCEKGGKGSGGGGGGGDDDDDDDYDYDDDYDDLYSLSHFYCIILS